MISSLNNAAVRQTAKLLKRRERERRRAFLVEGHRAVGVALRSGAPVSAFFFTARGRRRDDLLDLAGASRAKVSEVSDAVMAHLTAVAHAPDVLAVVGLRPTPLKAAMRGPFAVLLCGVHDPSVAGGILAAAAGAGATGAVACETTADVYGPECVRAAAGAHFVLPLAVASADEAVAQLESRRVVALSAEGTSICSVRMTTPIAIAVCDGEVPAALGDAERVALDAPAHGVGPGLVAQAAVAFHEVRKAPA